MRLLLDEHSPEIARQLRDRGRGVVAARERPELHGLSDRELLGVATAERRVLVTENVADFAELHRRSLASGEEHAGIVFTSSKRFPRTRRAIGRLVRALDALIETHPDQDALAGQSWWL
jgi:predicted nuclease of predicted toxin-antitoxin system